MCTKRARERGSNASIWQHFEGSYRCKWSKCAPCNCTSGGSSLCRLDAVMSVADSICFSSFPFFFFFLQDLISIPTQSFRILSSFLPNLPLLLFLLCQPISSGSSRNNANYRKEADVTAKHPCDGEESSRVVSPLLFPSLSWKFQPFQPHFFHIWHLHSLHFFSILFFLCVLASSDLPSLSADHTFWAVRCVSCLFSASALMGISNILHAGLHMERDKSLCNGTVMRYQSPNLMQVKGAVIPLFGGKTAVMEGILRRWTAHCSSVLVKWLMELQHVNLFIFLWSSLVTPSFLFYF